MKSQEPLRPLDYLSAYNHSSLKLPSFPVISELEKAIVGYVISNSAIKGGRKYEKSASYAGLRELVFEFYKMHYPHIISNFIKLTRKFFEKYLNFLLSLV